jgi:tRNA-dihydrouridine synthase B
MLNFWGKLDKPIMALAPMAGINNLAFRLICKKNGADVVYSEMVSADGLAYKNRKTLEMLKTVKAESPLILQLFGKNPERFKQAVKVINETSIAGIDINFGCPVQKVIRHGGGAYLMKNLDLCYEIVKTVCQHSKKPVSVKLRTSINHGKKKITALEFLKKIHTLPVAAIMIHGRTYEQGFSGDVDYQMIKDARFYFKGIILANGGILTPAIGLEALNKTGADGLGLARGAYGQPWIFKQLKEIVATGEYQTPAWIARKRIIMDQAKTTFKYYGDQGLIELRKHLLWYIKGIANASEIRQEIIKVTTLAEIKKILDKI